MSWDQLNVSAYRLYKLNQTNLAWIDNGIVPENEVTIHNVENIDIFAVAPIAKSGLEGLRSDALQLGKDETTCFYNQLNAYVVNDSITIQCQLTSPEWISKVVFESLHAGKFNVIDSKAAIPLEDQYYTTTDPTPSEGVNNYRIQIILKDGHTIYSDIVSISRLKETQFILYPNPVENKATVAILARDSDHFSFRLFDALGRQVDYHDIYEQEKEVSIEYLMPGIYLYQLYSDRGIKQTGRLVIK